MGGRVSCTILSGRVGDVDVSVYEGVLGEVHALAYEGCVFGELVLVAWFVGVFSLGATTLGMPF